MTSFVPKSESIVLLFDQNKKNIFLYHNNDYNNALNGKKSNNFADC